MLFRSILDKDVSGKVYGKPLTGAEQAKNLGLGDKIADMIDELEKSNLDYTSDIARAISNLIEGKVKGLVFTGRQDGKVAVIYDPGVVIPFAYKGVYDDNWTQVDKKSLGPAVSRSASGEWQKDKFDQSNMLKKLLSQPTDKQVIRGPVSLGDYPDITELPHSLLVQGDLDIRGSKLKSIPEFLRVTGNFYLDGSQVRMLPKGFRSWGKMIIRGSFDSLPEDLVVEDDLRLTGVTSGKLPAGNLSVEGDIYLPGDGSKIGRAHV